MGGMSSCLREWKTVLVVGLSDLGRGDASALLEGGAHMESTDLRSDDGD
jgi:hypothetical protein